MKADMILLAAQLQDAEERACGVNIEPNVVGRTGGEDLGHCGEAQ